MTGWWGGTGNPVVTQAMAYGASQDPVELAMALHLIAARRPQIVVEIGCDRGGTLYAWRQVCNRVYGITTLDNSYESGGSGLPLADHGAVMLIGDSHDPGTLQGLCILLDSDVDVLVLDGDHSPAGVCRDLATYGPLVADGGLILLHDITPGPDPRARVHEVWPELAAQFAVTLTLANPDGGYGWGVIVVQSGDQDRLAGIGKTMEGAFSG